MSLSLTENKENGMSEKIERYELKGKYKVGDEYHTCVYGWLRVVEIKPHEYSTKLEVLVLEKKKD